MPWYAIIARDKADSLAARKENRPAHLERIQLLAAEGRVLVAGPHPCIDSPDPGPAGFSGSLMIVEFDSLAAATEWADGDPYVSGGVFEHIEIKPFLKVLP